MIPGNANPLLLASAAAGAAPDAFTLQKSVRFNASDSAYFGRTFSAGNRKKWTWAGWLKRSNVDGNNYFFGYRPTSTPYGLLSFQGSGKITMEDFSAGSRSTTARFRDPSAWYHVVIVFDSDNSTAADRYIVYVNGVRQELGGSDYSSGVQSAINSSGIHNIGQQGGSFGSFYRGYMADIYFIDGSALDCTSFGAFDSNGVWQAAEYSGTFGTNGFHLLDFANESTIGHDSSGNENDFTAYNFSTSAGAGNDVLFDVPTNGTQSDTGAGGEVSGNYATLSPIDTGGDSSATLTNGNLEWFGGTTIYHAISRSTIGVSSGKWYVEVTITDASDTSGRDRVGIVSSEENVSTSNPVLGNFAAGYGYRSDGNKENNSSASSYGSSYTTGDVIGIALDMDAGNLVFYKNGTSQGTAFSSLSGTFHFCGTPRENGTYTFNFGQRAFAYSAPSGYKALCTTNLPTPTIADGSTAFDALTYSGNGSARTLTGLNMNPDLIWIKSRSSAQKHVLVDSVRTTSTGEYLASNSTDAEGTGVHISGTTDGITIADPNASTIWYNDSSHTYVAWAWDAGSSTASNTDGSITSSVRANQSAGFSIVNAPITNSGGTIGHGLNASPGMIIVKNRDVGSTNWVVWHKDIGTNGYLLLNSTAATATSSNLFNGTSSSTFTVGSGFTSSGTNNHICYCFAPVAGYSAFGSYTGNGSSDGVFVHTGFRVAWYLVKKTNAAGENWRIIDSTRSPHNVAEDRLLPNSTAVEGAQPNEVDFLSNGFKFRSTDGAYNGTGSTYVYAAFAENPFQANGGLAR